MKRHPQLLAALSTALNSEMPAGLHESAAAVLVLNELLLEKLERVLPDYHPGERTQETLAGLSELCWRTSRSLRANLEALNH